jgi:hypothetical protein
LRDTCGFLLMQMTEKGSVMRHGQVNVWHVPILPMATAYQASS